MRDNLLLSFYTLVSANITLECFVVPEQKFCWHVEEQLLNVQPQLGHVQCADCRSCPQSTTLDSLEDVVKK